LTFIENCCTFAYQFTIKNNKEMTTEKKHELARLVMEVIAPNQNLDLEEFVLYFRMLKTEQKLCDFVLELFNDDDEKLRCIQKIESFVDETNGTIFLSDLQLDSDVKVYYVSGHLQGTVDWLGKGFAQISDDSSETCLSYEYLPLDTLKELCVLLEKYKK
jgi:hypothetical protein